jgi:hypothetical protein
MNDVVRDPARHCGRGPRVLGPAYRAPLPPEPESPPSCPGCARELTLTQPDKGRPDDMIGACTSQRCGEWIVLRRHGSRWLVRERIPREHVRPPSKPRPAAIAAAAG